MIEVLILMHVLAGTVAISGMITAFCGQKGGRRHRLGGKAYVMGMGAALLLALIVASATANLFLVLIGVFSAYLVYTGWRLATVRNGEKSELDRRLTQLMLVVPVVMLLFGTWQLVQGDTLGIALMVFAMLAFMPARTDHQRDKWPVGTDRVILHLNRMGGASIATVTAVFVVNVQTTPTFIAWLLPSVVMTPVISYFSRETRRQHTAG